MKLINDEVYIICNFLNLNSNINMLIVSKNISYYTKTYFRLKYSKFKNVITLFNTYRKSLNKYGRTYGDCMNLNNALSSNEISLSTDIYTLYELMLYFGINYEDSYVTIPDIYTLKNEFNNESKKRSINCVIIMMNYIGMSRTWTLFSILNTNKYFITLIDRGNDDHVNRLNNLKLENIELFTIEDSVMELIGMTDYL